jgi:hypothetical protein
MEPKGKILIVDDNEDVLLSLNMLLRPWVEAVRVLTHPDRILEFMDSFHPDVILLERYFENGHDAFGKPAAGETFRIALNRSTHPRRIAVNGIDYIINGESAQVLRP